MTNLIEIKNLSYSYDKNNKIFNDLSLNIEKGKITTILGKNGCGKSTLIKILAKNLKYSSGSIVFNERELNDYSLKQFSQNLAIVYQKNNTPEDITVYEMLSLARLPYKNIFLYNNSKEDIKQIDFAIAQTNLENFRNSKVSDLSGGQLQRVYIAMALAQNTNTIILDEPTTYLDIKYQKSTMELIKYLNKNLGITIIMVLHDINQSLMYSDNIIALKDGKVIKNSKADNFYNEKLLSKIYDTNIEIKDNIIISW